MNVHDRPRVKSAARLALLWVVLATPTAPAETFDANTFAERYRKQIQSKRSVQELADFVNKTAGPEIGVTGALVGFANGIDEGKYLHKLNQLTTISPAQWKQMPASFQHYSVGEVHNLVSESGRPGRLSRIAGGMQKLGRAVAVVSLTSDIIGALQGDKKANFNAMKGVMQLQTEIFVNAVDAPNLSLAMAGVAVVGYALDKFVSTTMQQYEDYWWNAYVYYMEGRYPSPLKLTLLAHRNGPEALDRVLTEFWVNAEINAAEYFQASGGNRPANYRNITGKYLQEYKRTFAARYYQDFLKTTMETFARKNAEEAMAANALAAEREAERLRREAEKLALLQQILAALPDETTSVADIEASLEACEFDAIESRIAALEEPGEKTRLSSRLTELKQSRNATQKVIARSDREVKACEYKTAFNMLNAALERPLCPADTTLIKDKVAELEAIEDQRLKSHALISEANAELEHGRYARAVALAREAQSPLLCESQQNVVEEFVIFVRERGGLVAEGESICPDNAHVYWNKKKLRAACRCNEGYQVNGNQCVAAGPSDDEAAAEMAAALFESMINMAGQGRGTSGRSGTRTGRGCNIIQLSGRVPSTSSPAYLTTLHDASSGSLYAVAVCALPTGGRCGTAHQSGYDETVGPIAAQAAVQRARNLCPDARIDGTITVSNTDGSQSSPPQQQCKLECVPGTEYESPYGGGCSEYQEVCR